MRSHRDPEAAKRFADRRRREDEAPRLIAEVPELASLNVEISERRGDAPAESTHVRRIVVASAPAHFEIPCSEPTCEGGGHDLTDAIMRALRAHQTKFAGDDVCHGTLAGEPCGRTLRYAATATYR